MNMMVSSAAITAATPAHTSDLIDYRGVLRRVEQMIDILRTRYVRDGWSLDEAGAQRTTDYCRKLAAGAAIEEDEEQAMIDFMRQHGQSLDWILCGDPSGMICARAARSERAAKHEGVDPVYAAIAKCQASHDKYSGNIHRLTELKQSLPKEKRQWMSHVSKPEPPVGCTDDPEWIAVQLELISGDETCACIDLVSTCPTTTTGLHDWVRFIRENDRAYELLSSNFSHYDAEGEPVYIDCSEVYQTTMEKALSALV